MSLQTPKPSRMSTNEYHYTLREIGHFHHIPAPESGKAVTIVSSDDLSPIQNSRTECRATSIEALGMTSNKLVDLEISSYERSAFSAQASSKRTINAGTAKLVQSRISERSPSPFPRNMSHAENGKNEPAASQRDLLNQGGPIEYKSCGWLQCGWLMLAETISLGILTLPSAIATIGLAPGILVIVGLGIIASYNGFVIWQFRMRYPNTISMADCGAIMFGRFGRELFAITMLLVLVFVMSAHILTFMIAMNEITNHATCQIVWGVVGTILSLMLTLPRTLKHVSYFACVSFVSITAAILITMVYLGVTKTDGQEVFAFVEHGSTSLTKALVAVLDITIAYAGHVAFVGFIAELKQPVDFPKSLALLQIIAITFYVLVASLIYYCAGANLSLRASPILLATSPLVKKAAFATAMPTILVAGVIYGHSAAKYVFTRLYEYRNPRMIGSQCAQAWLSWTGISSVLWILSWVISQAVPGFNDLLALLGALLVTWFTFMVTGMFWLHMNRDRLWHNWRKACLTILNLSIISLGLGICVMGLYGAGTEISQGAAGKSFSCGLASSG